MKPLAKKIFVKHTKKIRHIIQLLMRYKILKDVFELK